MEQNFSITPDRAFLRHFYNKQRVATLSQFMVGKLEDYTQNNDPYAKYGYGRWLYIMNPFKGAIEQAEKLFTEAAENGVADAWAAIGRMHSLGEYHTKRKDDEAAKQCYLKARAMGSELAELTWINEYVLVEDNEKEVEKTAKAIENKIANDNGIDPLWHEYLGDAYALLGRTDDSIAQYEQAILHGNDSSYYPLALTLQQRGNVALAEEYMQMGIDNNCLNCFTFQADMDQQDFLELSLEQQAELHENVEKRLVKGLELGNGYCAFFLAYNLIYEELGFKQDYDRAIKALRRGIELGDMRSCSFMVALQDSDFLPDEERITQLEIAETRLQALRLGDESLVEQSCWDLYVHELLDKDTNLEEFDKIWYPLWKKKTNAPDLKLSDTDDDDKPKEAPPTNIGKTEITPTVLIIYPDGLTEFAEEDLESFPTYKAMGAMIDAEGLDTVHYSKALAEITSKARTTNNVVFYADRDGFAKNLPDNAVGTMLYGTGAEIRGPIIVGMEDSRHETLSFHYEEDIEKVYEAIEEMSGGLTRRLIDDDDSRYDPYV